MRFKLCYFALLAPALLFVSGNFYTDSGQTCETSPMYHRDYGNALIGHVIRRLPLFIADCMTACYDALNCFSINSYFDQNKGFMCELNRSTKKQSPNDVVSKTGYEYAEAPVKKYCGKNGCQKKEALADGWFKFNTSKFKFFSQLKTWLEAKNYCRALGGDLASFNSALETMFILQTVNLTTAAAEQNSSSSDAVLVNLKMDGTDPSEALSLKRGAAVVDVDNTKAVFFDGIDDFATIPRFSARATDLTFALWVKVKSPPGPYMALFADVWSQSSFRLFFLPDKIRFVLFNNADLHILLFESASDIPLDKWIHVAVTWNRKAKKALMFLNAIQDSSKTTKKADIDLRVTPYATYTIGAVAAGTKQFFKGWLKNLYVTNKTLSAKEITDLKDNFYANNAVTGVWIGLNDINYEGAFRWSSGTRLSYSQQENSTNTEKKDCVVMTTDENTSQWLVAECDRKMMFLCERK